MIPTVQPITGELSADLAEAVVRARSFAANARANATRRAYASDLAHFETWCRNHGLAYLSATPAAVGTYLAAHADSLSIATLTRRLSSIAAAHRAAGHGLDTRHPAIRDVMRGLRREKGTAQRQAAPITVPILKQMVSAANGDRLIDLRDRALVLVATAGALRRSELVALQIADITAVPQGLRVNIRRSKGDQEGAGELIQIGATGRATCPVTALRAWLAAAGIVEGPLFRSVDRYGHVGASLSTRAVALIVKQRVTMAGLDAETFSGHSMRAGFATSAAEAGIEERVIAKQTRHRSMSVLRRYIREGDLFAANLAATIGL